MPVGVCGAITPWNHPLLIATKKIAPALACGNVVVCKPSELAPLSVLELGQLALAAGLPEGVLTIVTGQREAGAALVTHPTVQRIDLTGSTATGITIQREAAPTLKRIGLELGGKAANIIFGDVDLHVAVQGALFGGFIGQGQTCIAGSRVLVERHLLEAFLDVVRGRGASDRRERSAPARDTDGPADQRPGARAHRELRRRGARGRRDTRHRGWRPALDGELRDGHFFAPTVLLTEDPSHHEPRRRRSSAPS